MTAISRHVLPLTKHSYLLDIIHWIILMVLTELDHFGQHAVLDVGQRDLLGVGAVIVCSEREVGREEAGVLSAVLRKEGREGDG